MKRKIKEEIEFRTWFFGFKLTNPSEKSIVLIVAGLLFAAVIYLKAC